MDDAESHAEGASGRLLILFDVARLDFLLS